MTVRASQASDLYDLRLRALWSAFTSEGLAFWLLCAYLMFEYVRPQSVYPPPPSDSCRGRPRR